MTENLTLSNQKQHLISVVFLGSILREKAPENINFGKNYWAKRIESVWLMRQIFFYCVCAIIAKDKFYDEGRVEDGEVTLFKL